MTALRPQNGLLWKISLKPYPRDAYNSCMVGFLRDSSSKFTFLHQLRLNLKGFVILDGNPSRIDGVISKENRLKFCGKFSTSDSCKRFPIIISLAGSEDGIPVQDGSYTKVGDVWDEARIKLNASLQGGESEVYPVQILHEAARKFQLAMEKQGSLKKNGWFTKSWLGVDQNYWIKPLAYQAAVHALLRAGLEIACRGEGRDRDAHIFVQRSIIRLCNPLEDSINQELSSRDPTAEEWFWSEQHPIAVAGFVDMLERDARFIAVTSIGWEGAFLNPSKASDAALLTLAISNTAAVLKLGLAKLSCPLFMSTLTEETSRLMNMLTELIPIDQVYHFTSGVGLRHEFLRLFGPRAVGHRSRGEQEGAFWVDLIQQQLRGAISREHIKSKLTSYDSIEVLERDLSVFGFFAALGRSTRFFLAAKNVDDSNKSLAGLLRYLIGGSVLFYPQLASLNTYQLLVELVCEEMDWLPLYPTTSPMPSHASQEEGTSHAVELAKREAISLSLDKCSQWIGDFIQYCTWIQQPSGVRASRFLLNSQNQLDACLEAFCLPSQQRKTGGEMRNNAAAQPEYNHVQMPYQVYWECMTENVEPSKKLNDQQMENGGFQRMYEQLNLFDKELQRVDEVVSRLDSLLKEPDWGPGKHHLTAACTNLEKIRKLKREVENLEASLRSKASAMQQNQAQDDATSQRYVLRRSGSVRNSFNLTESSDGQQKQNRKLGASDYNGNKSQGLGIFLPFWSCKRSELDQNETLTNCGKNEEDAFEQAAALALQEASTVSTEIQRFETLRAELIDLEKRIHECAGDNPTERESVCDLTNGDNDSKSLSKIGDSNKSGDIFANSLVKIKEATSDVWRGTQLLATDVAAAIVLLNRSVTGDKLTNREKKVLKRTLTDLASVVPIGFLMLLPVTAVGHAAILAAIQRYAPALIPSAYAPERLDLFRQLEQVRHMEVDSVGDTKASQDSLSVNKGEYKVSS